MGSGGKHLEGLWLCPLKKGGVVVWLVVVRRLPEGDTADRSSAAKAFWGRHQFAGFVLTSKTVCVWPPRYAVAAHPAAVKFRGEAAQTNFSQTNYGPEMETRDKVHCGTSHLASLQIRHASA
jgi:hypothetical protein